MHESLLHEYLKACICGRMLTVWLPMCSTVAPMARGGRGDITGNVPLPPPRPRLHQCTSPCTHVQGVCGAPTGAVGGAADGRRREIVTTQRYTPRLSHMTKLHTGTLRPHPIECACQIWLCSSAVKCTFGWYTSQNAAPRRFFSTICNAYVQMTRATSQTRK